MCKGPEAGGIEVNVKNQKKASVARTRKHLEKSPREESEAVDFDSNQIQQPILKIFALS